MADRLKVIQWTTGQVGKMALRAVFDDPRLDLVGVYAHSSDKVGLDAGAICGRPDCGIMATGDVAALLALGADIVIYAPALAEEAHVVALLESGVDVISTSLLSNLGGVQGALRDTLDAACRRGGTSFYITGVNPGWIDTLGAMATSMCRRVESLTTTESVEVANYEAPELWRGLGISQTEVTPELVASARGQLVSFRDAVARVADALKFTLDDTTFFIEYAKAARTVDLGWMVIPADTFAAIHTGWDGIVDGRAVIRNRVLWYMTRDIVEEWPIDQMNYYVDIVGEPGMTIRVDVKIPAHWSNLEHVISTALPAVSSAFNVHAAPPGILGLEGAGLPVAPAGVWAGAT